VKVDFTTLVLNENNDPIMQGKDDPVTLAAVTRQALLNPGPGEEKVSGEEKFKRFQLAMKCEGVVDLQVDEVAAIKKRIGVMCPPLIVGRCWNMLEGTDEKRTVN